MEQKVRIAVIGLIVLLIISFVIILGVLSSKQTLERQITQLDNERTTLRKQADDIATQKRQLEDKFGALNNDIKRVAQEKDDLQKRYELLDRTKDDLLSQIKTLKEKAAAAAETRAPSSTMTLTAPVQPAPTADAYWGEILKSKTDLELQVGAVRNELKNLQIANEQLQREKANLEMDLTTLKRDNQDFVRQLGYNQKVMDSVTSDLVREKNDKNTIEEGLKVIKVENNVLKRQVKSLSSRKIVLEKKVAEFQEKNSTLEKRFNEMEVLLKDKMSQVENIKTQIASPQKTAKDESVELPPITVRPAADNSVSEAQSAAEASAFRGKIVAINRDNNFVVVDIGQDSGINVGDSFQAYREDKLVAKLETIQVRQNIAACDIKKELSPVRVGDNVR
jgi:chromosome segregation ATPase